LNGSQKKLFRVYKTQKNQELTMTFRPKVGDNIQIGQDNYIFNEHPAAPGMLYGQSGRRATVFQLQNGKTQLKALKVFTLAFRSPQVEAQAAQIAHFAALPGLTACRRQVLSPTQNIELLSTHPDLRYAVLMPWMQGTTWQEWLMIRQPLSEDQSHILARCLVKVLAVMEKNGIAHCDLSSPNVMIHFSSNGSASSSQINLELIDLEDLYATNLRQPEKLPAGSAGYSHHTVKTGVWSPQADRFAGAILLAEMLGWCDKRVCTAAVGEQYFDPNELQVDCSRQEVLCDSLSDHWGAQTANLFQRAWYSDTLTDCPTFAEWADLLNIDLPHIALMPGQTNKPIQGSINEPVKGWRTFNDVPIQFDNRVARTSYQPFEQSKPQSTDELSQMAEPPIRKIEWLIPIGITLALMVFFIGLLQGWLDFQTTAQPTSNLTQGKISLTQTAQVKQNKTATVVAALTETAVHSSLLVDNLQSSNELLASIISGELVHEENGSVKSVEVSDLLSDFILEIDLINPYDSQAHNWDYGILFRDTGGNDQYRLVIFSDGSWVLNNNTGDANGERIQEGYIDNLRVNETEYNHIRLAAISAFGYLFVNGQFIAELDLSARLDAGAIKISTGIFNGDEVNGEVTRFRDVFLYSAAEITPTPSFTQNCVGDFSNISIANHYITKKTSTWAYYTILYSNPRGWPEDNYKLSIGEVNDDRASSYCNAPDQVLECTVSSVDTTLLRCPAYSFWGSSSYWCVLEAQLVSPACGEIYTSNYTYQFPK
jgi:serine/threonine protein kinase